MKFVESGVQTITSYDVANTLMEHDMVIEMNGEDVVMNHDGVLKVIEASKPFITQYGADFKDYFIEHTYQDKRGRIKRYYDCTQLGSELIAGVIS